MLTHTQTSSANQFSEHKPVLVRHFSPSVTAVCCSATAFSHLPLRSAAAYSTQQFLTHPYSLLQRSYDVAVCRSISHPALCRLRVLLQRFSRRLRPPQHLCYSISHRTLGHYINYATAFLSAPFLTLL
jgi:hypothetical protein